MATPSIEKGIDVVTKAAEEDRNHNYREALKLYGHGVEYFFQSIKYDSHSDKSKDHIREKCTQYLERAEKLKEFLKQDQKPKKPQKTVAGDTISNKKKSSESDSDSGKDVETKKFQSMLSDAIVVEKPNVHWEDVAGLYNAKEALKESVILPIKFPQLFTGKRTPWKGILLYGAPGTGKSFLAKVISSEVISVNFFYVISSILKSIYSYKSENLVRDLFDAARTLRPSVIYFDEIDHMCNSRSDNESGQRITKDLISEMKNDNKNVTILASTNVPWSLDSAVTLLFEKKIHIPMPDISERVKIFKRIIAEKKINILNERNIQKLVHMTEGFSGADIVMIVKESLMIPIKKCQIATHFKKVSGPSPVNQYVIAHDLLTPCSPGEQVCFEMMLEDIPSDKLLEPPVTMADVVWVIKCMKPSVRKRDIDKFQYYSDGLNYVG